MDHRVHAALFGCVLGLLIPGAFPGFTPAPAHASEASRSFPTSTVYRYAKEATVLIMAVNEGGRSVSMGSGFFVTADGLLLTNAHVVEDSAKLYVYVHDQLVHAEPRVVAIDPDLDLAALRISGGPFPVLTLAAELPVEGTEAVSVGYPRITDVLQMGFALHGTVGSGIVSGVAQGRSRKSGRAAKFVQTTGILNFGNSGGPLVDVETAEVAGMVVTTVPYAERARDRSGASVASVSLKSGIGYSIPATVIRQWLTERNLPYTRSPAAPAGAAPIGPEPDAARSFATGHILQVIAGVLQQDSDLLNLAIYHYEMAASLRPDAPWIVKNLGRAYASTGRWSDALKIYQKAIESAPPDAELLSDLGLAWQRTGNRDRAAESYRAAVKTDPRSARAHNNLGQLLWEMGNVDDAIGEFRDAVRYDPALSLAAYNLGLALESKGRLDEALTTWEGFLKVSGQRSEDDWTPKIRDGLARLRTAQGPASRPVITSHKQ